MAEIRIEKKKNWLPWILALLGFVLLAWLAVDLFDSDGEPELLTADEVDFPDLHVTDRPDNDRLNAKVQGDANAVANEEGKDNTSTAKARRVALKKINLDELDVDWDGSNASYDENMIYYISSLDKLNAEMSLDHDYSNVVLRALANSLIALSRQEGMTEDVELKQKVDLIRKKAMQITQDWKSTKHADMIKSAALAASDVIVEIQKKKFPDFQKEAQEVVTSARNIQTGTLTLEQKENMKKFYDAAADALVLMRTTNN